MNRAPGSSVALLGMEACYGAQSGLAAFARGLHTGQPLPSIPPQASESGRLALQAMEGALADARLSKDWRVAVLAPAALGENFTGRVYDRLAQRWTIVRPVLAWPGNAASFGSALVEAQALLAARQTDVVLLAEAGHFGAGALALARPSEAPAERVYAVLEAATPCPWPEASTAPLSYLETLEPPEAIDYAAYRSPEADLTCALSAGAGSAIAALIKVALCLHRRTLPPLLSEPATDYAHLWQQTPFYPLAQACPWFSPRLAPRRAALRLPGSQGHLCLVEPAPHRAGPSVCLQPGETACHLFPLAAEAPEALLTQLAALEQALGRDTPWERLARETFAAYQRQTGATYTLALVSHTPAELRHEIKFALEAVPQAFSTGKPWASPRGSYFTPQPLGPAGVTFVYPGAFNAYVGLGRELFQHFPILHERLAAEMTDVGRALAERILYPRRQTPASEADTSALAAKLAANPAAMIETGVLFAMAFTALARDVFGIQPRAALGYSLGEVSMLWAGGVWSGAEAGSAAWQQSPLFKTRLFGPKDAVREAWQLPAGRDDFWHTYLLKAPLEKVQTSVATEPRVYITMINLADEVVIAGEAEACRRVVATLNCHALRIPFESVIHNAAMQSEFAALADLYSNPVHTVPGVTFYSAAHYAPLPLERHALARALARMTCAPLDFPRLVNAAYADGARLFVELGPQATCTRWIERILRGREHAAIAINRPRTGDYEGVLAMLAMLVSQRVPVNLSPLYGAGAEPTIPESAVCPNPVAVLTSPDRLGLLSQQAAHQIQSHQAFLQTRQALLPRTAELLRLQTSAAQHLLTQPPTPHAARRFVRFDERAIAAFAQGNPEACFGPDYGGYRGRRLPRLPNGELLFVSRIPTIDGPPGKVEAGASLTGEYDLPARPWFLNGQTTLPYTALMEIALQPCGFLSAYLGSTLPYPEMDFYFRNLDGEAQLLESVDVRGQTITSRARLISSAAIQGIILQKFEFELACAGTPFYRGTSSFGYFTSEALASQTGLGNQPSQCLPVGQNQPGTWRRVALSHVPHIKLDRLDQIWVSPTGGRHGHGSVYAEARLRPTEWFYKCHFYQDPVMPGSLGVEAIRQAMQVFALQRDLRPNPRPARFRPAPGPAMTWKYRGQITPTDHRLRLEIDLTEVLRSAEGLTLRGNASVWNGETRVYEIKQVAVQGKREG